jgi:uncharacterized membrane protein
MNKTKQLRPLGKERLNALSEGVFAVVMTLMLLSVIDEITTPEFDIHHLNESLQALWPKFSAFFISFFVVGALWIGDNVMLDDISFVDVRFLWIKMLHLLTITFLGFSTTLFGEHPEQWQVETLYGFNMVALYLSTGLGFRYAVLNGLMERREDNRNLLRGMWTRILIGVGAYALGPVFSVWNPMYSFYYFILLAGLFSGFMMFSSFEWLPVSDENQTAD